MSLSNNGIIGPFLTLFGKLEKGLGYLEKHPNVPSALMGRDDLLVAQGCIGGKQGQPLFHTPVPGEDDLGRNGNSQVVFADLDHDRSENLRAASSFADRFPASLRSVGATVKICAHGNQTILFLAGRQQCTGNGQKTVAVRPTQGEQPESAIIPMVGMVKDPRKQLDLFASIVPVKRIIGDQHLHVDSARPSDKIQITSGSTKLVMPFH